MRQQMALGEFVFGLATGFPYERLERKTTGGWVDLDIISSKPLSHQTGQGLEELRLSGKAQLEAGMLAVDELRAMANARKPYTLVDGIGRVWGRWRIVAGRTSGGNDSESFLPGALRQLRRIQ